MIQPLLLFLERWAPPLFCVAALMLAMGCGHGTSSSHEETPLKPPRAESQVATPFKDLLLPPLICARKSLCPSAVGELVTVTSAGVKTCTATLIEAGVVLTASHCVPWENVESDGRVRGRCWVRWPRRGMTKQEEAIPCQSVKQATSLSSSHESEAQIDAALLRLERPSKREALHLDPAAIVADADLTLFGVDPGDALHVLRRFECRSARAHAFHGKTVDPERAFVMPGCPAVTGNSGGPILDDQGEIVGVISVVEMTTPRSGAATGPAAPGATIGPAASGAAIGSRLGVVTHF